MFKNTLNPKAVFLAIQSIEFLFAYKLSLVQAIHNPKLKILKISAVQIWKLTMNFLNFLWELKFSQVFV